MRITTLKAWIPLWSWLVPLSSAAVLLGAFSGLLRASGSALLLFTLLLGASVFVAVHHAETVAHKVGEPYGSIVLALSVTIIEVSLIVALMISSPDKDTLARDTVFSTVMIVLNLVIGLCLFIGGRQHRVQQFSKHASTTLLSVLATLVIMTLVLPNYTGGDNPMYRPAQLIVVAAAALVLYVIFLVVQTTLHQDMFVGSGAAQHAAAVQPSAQATWLALILLLIALVSVVLLAKMLSVPMDAWVLRTGLPGAIVPLAISAVVLLPESITAVRAARKNDVQTSLNLAVGSALATIGLTIPMVALASLLLHQNLVLGLDRADQVMAILTLLVSTITLTSGQSTIMQGAVHLVIFVIYLLTVMSW